MPNRFNALRDTNFQAILDSLELLYTQTAAWRDRAGEWAAAPENVEVADGKYSAMHYALKAEGSRLAADLSEVAAQAAQLAAETALTDAVVAQAASEVAQQAAELAQGIAESEADAAGIARQGAETAEDYAVQAQVFAEDAQSAAETAEGNAADSADLAEDERVAAEQAAALAMQYRNQAGDFSDIAESYAHYQGVWSTMSGALPKPASVFHNGTFWMALDDIADVAASEPDSENTDWSEIGDSVKSVAGKTGAVDLVVGDVAGLGGALTAITEDVSTKAGRDQVALPVPDLGALMSTDPAQFSKALVSGYYEEGDIEKSIVWQYNPTRSRGEHDGWSCINPDHLSEIGSAGWYAADGDSTDDDGSGVWERSIPDQLNILEVGAKLTENDDFTNQMQIAIDSGVKRIIFPPSRQGVLGSVNITKPVEIIGNRTELSGNDGSQFFNIHANAVTIRDFISITGNKFFCRVGQHGDGISSFKDFTLSGIDSTVNGASACVVLRGDVDNVLIERCEFENISAGQSTGVQLLIGDAGLAAVGRRLIIRDNIFRGGLRRSFDNFSTGVIRGLVFSGNIDQSKEGIRSYHCFDSDISHNRFLGQSATIYIWYAMTVSHNLFSGSTAAVAVKLENLNGIFTGNTVRSAAGAGILLDGAAFGRALITDNIISGIGGEYAIKLTRGEPNGERPVNPVIKNNILYDGFGHGIMITGMTERALIEGNSVRGFGRGESGIYAGIIYRPGSGAAVRSATFRSNIVYGNDLGLGISDSKLQFGIHIDDTPSSEPSYFYAFHNDLNAPVPFRSERNYGEKYFCWNVVSNISNISISPMGNRLVSNNINKNNHSIV